MSRKHFSLLLAAAVVATLAVLLLVPGKTGREPEDGDGRLLTTPPEWVNGVSEVVVQHGSDSVTLQRSGEAWRIAELQGYPADWARLRELLANLSAARVVERKTDNPAYYDRLGVEDPQGEDAGGALLRLVNGEEDYRLVVGKAATRGGGQYVRPADDALSLLIDQELDVPRGAIEWAQRQVVNVPSAQVAEVEIIHPDGDWVLAEKQNPADTDFTLASLPEGREVTSSWSVNALGGALTALRMDDVLPAVALDDATVTRFRLLTFDGVEYTVNAWTEEDAHWIQLRAAAVGAGSGQAENAETEEPEAPAVATADEFNQRSGGWRYRLPKYNFDALTKRSEDLLQALEDDAEASGQ